MTMSFEIDRSYLKTYPGIFRVFTLSCSFLGFWCIIFSSIPASNPRSTAYLFVICSGFIVTAWILFARLINFWQKKFPNFDYMKFEKYAHIGFAAAYFLVSIFTITLDLVSFSVAAFFSLMAFLGYLVDVALMLYKAPPQKDASTQTSRQMV